ncbi:helicase HerA domain-containing protein [Sorangium sp. So ce124]|uniref:helicase HerA domain-containing protein n=1 Tax=Sorangium sp. So ce124 TaxID=3133280 RepID=UPI003F626072
MDGLKAFEAVDFQSTQNLDSVWQDPRYDVPSLHQKGRREVLAKVRSMAESQETGSPLGWVFVGPAGIGKTHMLSAIRREIFKVPASFVLVHMTDVHDFWETVLLGFIDSLQRPAGATDRTQGQLVVQHIAAQVRGGDGAAMTRELATLRPPKLVNEMDALVQGLGRAHRAQTLKHADTLRALVLLNSDDMELSNLGYAWLQGHGVDESDMKKFDFNIREKRSSAVVEGLSWLTSLRCPTVVAIDHLDAIVTEHHLLADAGSVPDELSARQIISRNIIESVGRGLMELRDVTRRTLTVVACLFETWDKMKRTALKSTAHRYEDPRILVNLSDVAMAEDLVSARLDDGYARVGFRPPYPRWPFAPSAFTSIADGGKSPRDLLRRCEQHRRKCLDEERITELTSFVTEEAPPRSTKVAPVLSEATLREHARLDAELERLRTSVKGVKGFTEPDGEDALGDLLRAGCELVVAEQAPDPAVEIVIDAQSGEQRNYPALHARVRQIFTAHHDRERHFCLRALTRDNAIAFQARLTAAMTASGIDRQIEFRKLVLVRNAPVPSGAKTTVLMAKARAAGAELTAASEDDLRVLAALVALRGDKHVKLDTFEPWLRERRPASRLALMKPVADWLGRTPQATAPAAGAAVGAAAAGAAVGAAAAGGPPAPGFQPPAASSTTSATTVVATAAVTVSVTSPATHPGPAAPAVRPVVAVGHHVIGDRLGALQVIPAEDLKQHVVVLAGAGSGKTVLLRRLIEETALLGIPSIVVDGANDLTRLGEPWPERPGPFTGEDVEKAARYHAQTDVIVWTPGRSSGNPLHLGLIPDFAAVAHDPDDLTQTIAMTASTLAAMAGKKADEKARAILDAALRFFVQGGGGDLSTFLDVLGDLPDAASLKISTARKVATALTDSLRAAVQTNPLLHQEGEPLDPGVLFGIGSERPRVSVLSLVGLPGLDAPLQFVNQLAMTLFTWVKKNPCPPDRPLRGLLVIDEAKDFVPSHGSTPCKESLIRLAAQGRKYGLGVVFATQAPKSIDHNVIANASTQFYGKASSPAAIDTVEEQLRVRGGTKFDVATLPKGRFYLAGNGMAAPVKVAVPMCLSHHPASPPDEDGVLRRARASRARLQP